MSEANHCCHKNTGEAPAGPPGEDLAGKYICPMCPGVVSDEPAACPKCGMALEQVLAAGALPSADATDDPEYRDMKRRFIVAAIFSLPLLIIAMGGMFTGEHRPWLQLVLAAPVCLWAGLPFFRRAWTSIRSGNLNMFTLIGLGVFVAFGSTRRNLKPPSATAWSPRRPPAYSPRRFAMPTAAWPSTSRPPPSS